MLLGIDALTVGLLIASSLSLSMAWLALLTAGCAELLDLEAAGPLLRTAAALGLVFACCACVSAIGSRTCHALEGR
jgi:hypothetical protein